MSQYTTPIDAAFAMQRTAITGSRRAIQQGLDLQRTAGRLALAGLESQEAMQRHGVELLHAATRSYLDGVAATAPVGEADVEPVREATDEGFARLTAAHAETFDAFERAAEATVESHDELAASSADAIDEGVEELLDAHEELHRETLATIDEAEERTEEFQHAFEAQLDEQLERTAELQQAFEARIDDQLDEAAAFQERLREQAAAFEAQLQSQAEAFEIAIDDETA